MTTETTPQAEATDGNPVGTIKMIVGTVNAQSPDGTIRILHVNSPVFFNDLIITGQEGMVSIAFNDGSGGQMELGRMAEVLLDEDVLQAGAPEEIGDSELSVEEMQQALLAGDFDPTAELEATAAGPAGPTGGGAGGGHTPFVAELIGQETSPGGEEAGTDGSGFSFSEQREAPDQQPQEEAPTAAPAAITAPLVARVYTPQELDAIEFDGEAFGYSSYESNFPNLENLLGQADYSELLEEISANFSVENLGVGTPGAQLVGKIQNADDAVRVEIDGAADGLLSIQDGQLAFTPDENFEKETDISFTIYYSNGDYMPGSVTVTERYLKVGSFLSDNNSVDTGVGYVVGDGDGNIKGGDASDILIGDSVSLGNFLDFDQLPPGLFQEDKIVGKGGDDHIFGDAINTDQLATEKGLIRDGDSGSEEQGLLPFSLPVGMGWYTFTILELVDPEWDRTTTIDYILEHEDELMKGSQGGDDIISAGDGDDNVYGQGGDDVIKGGDGNDLLVGSVGEDILKGGSGADKAWGGDDDDVIFGGGGDDILGGGEGEDTIEGGSGDDIIYGGKGPDHIFGGGDDDILIGNGGRDEIFGGRGDDKIHGGGGNDTLEGGKGADQIVGGKGEDVIDGEQGRDILVGDDVENQDGIAVIIEDGEEDTVTGGPGKDILGEAEQGTPEQYPEYDPGTPDTEFDIEELVPITPPVV